MSDNTKMMLRYAMAIGISFAAGRGWITPAQGDAITSLVIELAGVLIAFSPAVYAAYRIDNAPKT